MLRTGLRGDTTPAVSYSYDTGANGVGQLTGVTSNGFSTSYTSFDVMGHVAASSQTTGSQTYTFSNYTYNLAGALTKETYPSGRVVTTAYDGASRVSGVSGALAGATTNYVSGVTYWPHGAINSYTRANGLWYFADYNSRLQPVESYEALNNHPNQEMAVSCLNWGTQSPTACGGFFPASADNGTLQGKVDYAGPPAVFSALPSYSHTYAYDAVNRLTSDTDSGGASRTFTYDQWGNMATTGAVLSGLTPPSISGFNTNNRLSSSSFNYDNAGNMILQGTLSIGYDANNRQTSTSDSSSHVQASYSYDGLGNRVMKQANGSTTVYVYDAFGQMAAEYTSASSPAPCITCYLSYDHLGSVRMVTDQTGSNIIALHDYVPFGEEIPAGSGRSSSYGGTDGVSQRFTGQQRDTENMPALDFFGARYMSPVLGRFASPDPANAGADLTNPQSWNAYAYVLGNPLGLTDPSGMSQIIKDPGEGDPCFVFDASCAGPGPVPLPCWDCVGGTSGGPPSGGGPSSPAPPAATSFPSSNLGAFNILNVKEWPGSVTSPDPGLIFYDAVIAYLSQSPVARNAIAALKKSSIVYTILLNGVGKNEFDPKTNDIYWDPRQSHVCTSGGSASSSPALALGHELFHALGPISPLTPTNDPYENLEEKRVITGPERALARDLGECTRTTHSSVGVFDVPNPIMHY